MGEEDGVKRKKKSSAERQRALVKVFHLRMNLKNSEEKNPHREKKKNPTTSNRKINGSTITRWKKATS